MYQTGALTRLSYRTALAESSGLEPHPLFAGPGFQGRSRHHAPALLSLCWLIPQDSNLEPAESESAALPVELGTICLEAALFILSSLTGPKVIGGAGRTRTDNRLRARQLHSQLCYSPNIRSLSRTAHHYPIRNGYRGSRVLVWDRGNAPRFKASKAKRCTFLLIPDCWQRC